MGRKLTNSGRRYSYLTSEIEALYHEAAQKFELSDSALRILYTICLVGDVCPLSVTIRLSGISKQTVNSSLRNLEKHGALYLKTAGGKKKNIYLTEKGQALVEQSAMQVI